MTNTPKATIESGLQLLSRVRQSKSSLDRLHPVLFPNGGPHSNEILQITGEPSTGKTLLLTELLARCILPSRFDGKDCGAVIVNTDHHFSLLKLATVMESFLGDVKKSDVRSTIEASLKRLIVLNCYSSEQLRLTFQNLDRVLTDNVDVKFVAIDSVLSFYWYDRYLGGTMSMNLYCCDILKDLMKIVREHYVVVAFTKRETEQQNKCLEKLVDYTVRLQKGPQGFRAAVHSLEGSFVKGYEIGKQFVFKDVT